MSRPHTYTVNDETGCWEWEGRLNRYGYGAVHRGGRSRLIHRVVYEDMYGEIPEGFVVHHTCGVKHCVNPKHLELQHRSDHVSGHWAQKREASIPANRLEIDIDESLKCRLIAECECNRTTLSTLVEAALRRFFDEVAA